MAIGVNTVEQAAEKLTVIEQNRFLEVLNEQLKSEKPINYIA
jgi:hypothetical protein